ncbi:Holliday junction resolvase [Candidatus Heimdallarchaeota archaeon]|nr:MAG: Holliday junction resolvase [Candidatus Gerdarchaeota archaeon]RLI69639.1 MAG: Holliday junction resolvase [Candidatus Gerdarchaeota archaeon]RLI74061.1 MAG: Holliday junction resolvase [Candidatus Heimdallarchaeota archaeon]
MVLISPLFYCPCFIIQISFLPTFLCLEVICKILEVVLMTLSGVQAERDLVHLFWDAGFAVLRAPASGGGTLLPRPDLIAGSQKRQKFFVLEIKTARKDSIYISEEQINGLLEFASRLGFEAFLGVKFKKRRSGFLFLAVPDELERVKNSTNFKVTFAHASQKGRTVGELIGEYKQKRLLE